MDNNTRHIAPIELLTKYFANEASHEERIQVEEWKKSSPKNEKEFASFEKLWNITQNKQTSPINVDDEWQKMELVINSKAGDKSSFLRIINIAAVLVLVFTLAFWGYKQTQLTTDKTIVAETKTVTLPDGSIISLNAKSKISFNKGFGEKHRTVTLKGEGFFEVVPNKELPFIVNAGAANIEVVGTKFNVKAYKNLDDIKVAVTEGKVKLYKARTPEKQVLLEAGETGTFNRKEQEPEKLDVSTINDYAWKTLRIEFVNSGLNEVIGVLANTYHQSFRLTPPIKDCKITVNFEEQDLQSVIEVIQSTLDLKVYLDKKKTTIIFDGNGCQ